MSDDYMAEKVRVEAEVEAKYRATHSREGYGLGTPEYPDNREGRRRLARTWKRVPSRADIANGRI